MTAQRVTPCAAHRVIVLTAPAAKALEIVEACPSCTVGQGN